ncbi:MAG TPA: hypothetical protein PK228_13410 [Saprospiraceae bacterium]|nr:hypothetical protein [Saprospiraceae bacterium]
MKNYKYFLLVLACTLVSAILPAQSKKELSKSLKAEQAVSDSLRKELAATNTILDSLTERQKLATDDLSPHGDEYKNFYTYVFTKYLKPNLKSDTAALSIAQATALLDSLVVTRRAKLTKLDSVSVQSKDSIANLKNNSERLRVQLETLKRAFAESNGSDRQPISEADFMGSWDLFLLPVAVIGESPKSAIVSLDQSNLPDSLYQALHQAIPRSINFGKDDLAEITFMGGRTTNCFYKITGFSRTEPYYIDLSRGDDLSIRVYIVNTSKGLQISTELPAVKEGVRRFLFGYMKQ